MRATERWRSKSSKICQTSTAIVAPLGGGGLLAGIAAVAHAVLASHAYLRRRAGDGVAPRGFARRRAAPVSFERWTASFVDGAGGKSVLETMWPLLRALTGSMVVTLDDVAGALKFVAERAHVIAEGAAGCAVAAALSGRAGSGKCRRGRVGRQHRSAALRIARRRVRQFHSGGPRANHLGSFNPMNRYADRPPLPARIARLEDLATDSVVELERRRTPSSSGGSTTPCGGATAHNPVRMLWLIPPAKLEAGGAGSARSCACTIGPSPRSMPRAKRATHGGPAAFRISVRQTIAYFSAEFALHQSLPIYAGGLGVLAGDHCKEAGDLGVPLIGVGFMYPQGLLSPARVG